MAELGEWTAEFNGLVMGEPDSAISIVAVDGLLSLPDIRTADQTLVQRHGLWPGDDYLNGRTVTMTLEVYGSTGDEFTKALTAVQAAFLPAGDEKPFRFRLPGAAADRTAYLKARPRKRSAPLDLSFAYRVCNVVVELFATDPKIYGQEARKVTAKSSVRPPLDGGFTFPATVPFTVKGSSAPPADPITRFTQWGSVPARPVIEFRDAKNPVLRDDATGQWFGVRFDGACTADSAAQVVRLMDGTDVTGLVMTGSTWPEYASGDHRLRLTHDNEFSAASAALTWTDEWV
ncbi:hypothetical protein AB0M39_33395 [Streptomyces sp. NPDC051907]|uniref:hypothetical protein n=1 Tax=Streptomyces sp. NPDC051907 TaxID=3155284 RepID=UPI003425D1CF